MGADVLKLLVAPFLRAPAPGAGAHRVHHAAAAAPLAASMVLEPLGGFERLGARVLVGDVATAPGAEREAVRHQDRKSTRLNSSHGYISYAVFCLKKKKHTNILTSWAKK